MKTRQDFHLYSKYLDLHFADQAVAFSKFKNDSDLDHVEKELLNSRILVRNKQWSESFERLEKLKTEVPFFKAERYLQMASIELLRSRFEESAKFGNLAVRYFEICNDDIGLFRANYNLMAAFSRAGMNSLGLYFLAQSEKYALAEKEKLIIARAKACNLSKECKFDQAIDVINDVIKNQSKHNKLEWEYFLTAASDILFRAGRHQQALQIVSELMSSKTLLVRGRVLFYYHTMKYVIEGKQLPPKPDAITQIPEYSLKWDLIESIRSGAADEARDIWGQIVTMLPHNFTEGYRCINKSEEKSVFATLVSQLLVTKPECSVDLEIIKGKKPRILIELLMNSQTPMRKEILIEQIWNESYRPELDARFYKLVERVKGMVPVAIKNDNSAYYLSKAS